MWLSLEVNLLRGFEAAGRLGQGIQHSCNALPTLTAMQGGCPARGVGLLDWQRFMGGRESIRWRSCGSKKYPVPAAFGHSVIAVS